MQDQPRYLRRKVTVAYLRPPLHSPKRRNGALESCDCSDESWAVYGDRLLLFRNWSVIEVEHGDAGLMDGEEKVQQKTE